MTDSHVELPPVFDDAPFSLLSFPSYTASRQPPFPSFDFACFVSIDSSSPISLTLSHHAKGSTDRHYFLSVSIIYEKTEKGDDGFTFCTKTPTQYFIFFVHENSSGFACFFITVFTLR
jgi:hypothetical protein